jgi:hypothetical protein
MDEIFPVLAGRSRKASQWAFRTRESGLGREGAGPAARHHRNEVGEWVSG